MKETLTDWLNARNNFGIFYPPMKSEQFVEFIKDYLLNENWHTVNPVNNEQVYTEILIDVLDRYSKKYKKEKRGVLSERKWRGNRHKCRRHRRSIGKIINW